MAAIGSNTSERNYEYYLLSTTPKPVSPYIDEGSVCVEIDTLNVYFFDVDSLTWIKAE